jgi:hypothetical protein
MNGRIKDQAQWQADQRISRLRQEGSFRGRDLGSFAQAIVSHLHFGRFQAAIREIAAFFVC